MEVLPELPAAGVKPFDHVPAGDREFQGPAENADDDKVGTGSPLLQDCVA